MSVPSGSSAVMAQRIEPPDSFDDFPTPAWGTRAMIEHILKPRGLPLTTAWDPACNRGYMAKPLAETFRRVYRSDIFDYSSEQAFEDSEADQERVADFLWPGSESLCVETRSERGVADPPCIEPYGVDWVITNPPFKVADQFVVRARQIARVGCAMFVRTQFLEGQERYEELFSRTPPSIICQFAERIVLTKGIVRDPAKEYWDDDAKKMKRPSTATSYLWLVWVHGRSPEPFQWIPPCRTKLERPGDYPIVAAA